METVVQNPVNSIVLLTLQIKKASKTPSNRALRGAQIASTGILDAKIFLEIPLRQGDTPSRALPHSRLRRSCTPLAYVIQKNPGYAPAKYTIHQSHIKLIPCWAELFALYDIT